MILTISHNGTVRATRDLPSSTTFESVRRNSAQAWPEVANATVLLNGSAVDLGATLSTADAGSVITFSLPVGDKGRA